MKASRSVAILVLLLGAAALSCSGRKQPGEYPHDLVQSKSAPVESTSAGRLLVARASVEVVVDEMAAAVQAARQITEESGGYVRESTTQKESAAHLELAVPAERLSEVLDRLAELGEERSRHVSSADVTEEVGDLEAELANDIALRDRLRALLEKAKDVKDILAVEQELTRVQASIDRLEGRLKRLRENIAFSAVDLRLSPKGPEPKPRILGPLGYLYVGTKWLITKLFVIRPAQP